MKKYLILLFIVAVGCKSSAPKEIAPSEVTSEDAKAILSYLASDDLNGRDTGSEGIEKAALFIEERFSKAGVKPFFSTYRDSFDANGKEGFNVVGFLEGNDPKLKNEIIIIGAHYDHIGIGEPVANDSIANGANDNASGATAVVLIADYFAKSKSNKRSLMFALFSAEEKGLIGSRHLSVKLKEQNIDLYTMVNFEMLGVPLIDRDYEAFVSGYDLSNMASKMNEYVGSNLIGKSDVAVKYNLFERSDNYPFYEVFNKPCQSISSCDLSNFDYYHHVDDEVGLMNFEFMARLINKLIPAFEEMSNTPTKEIEMYE